MSPPKIVAAELQQFFLYLLEGFVRLIRRRSPKKEARAGNVSSYC